MKRLLIALTLGSLLGAGCDSADRTAKEVTPKSTDLGTGINTVDRSYPQSAAAMVDIVRNALSSFDLKIESDKHDELGGELVALRADGHKVTARITALDKQCAQVSVRVAPGNRNLAEVIQQRIAERLGGELHSK